MLIRRPLRGRRAGAAKPLGLEIEARLALAVFERLPGGIYLPTDVGSRAIATAERVEDEAIGLARDLAGQDSRLT